LIFPKPGAGDMPVKKLTSHLPLSAQRWI